MLSTSSVGGFVKGVITDSNNALLNGITVQIGGTPKVTGANGQYFTSISSGAVTIVVNPNNGVGAYMQVIQTVTITQGAITTQDFTLPLGGRITGYVTTGTTPLSNQPITATSGSGGQAGAATTDASGNFSIRNLSTGTYTIFPVLETGQDANPNTFVPILSSTGTLFIGTFTVTGALGSIDGTITDASGLVTTGALLVASTSTISSTLPLIAGSSAQALIPIYMASSKADGTFSVPVRGGATYYLSAFVPVINGASVTVTTKTYSGIIVSPSAATTRTVTIP